MNFNAATAATAKGRNRVEPREPVPARPKAPAPKTGGQAQWGLIKRSAGTARAVGGAGGKSPRYATARETAKPRVPATCDPANAGERTHNGGFCSLRGERSPATAGRRGSKGRDNRAQSRAAQSSTRGVTKPVGATLAGARCEARVAGRACHAAGVVRWGRRPWPRVGCQRAAMVVGGRSSGGLARRPAFIQQAA